jgi:hypothetical protein
MIHLVQSFQSHIGERGCHFYNEEDCTFLNWAQVCKFVDSLGEESADEFTDRLVQSLSNYDPDSEFLAVCQSQDQVSVELYAAFEAR